MTGWRLVVVLLVMFAAGYGLASWFALIRTEALFRRALAAEANTNHALCEVIEGSHRKVIAEQGKYIDRLEREFDAYRAGKDVGDEAEEYLRDGGST